MKQYKDAYRDVFGEDLQREPYVYIDHSFRFINRIGKSVCYKCGLVYLKNDFTEWSVRMGCNSTDHPSFKHKRKLTGIDK